MRRLRTVASALLIVAGAVSAVAWVASGMAMRAIHDDAVAAVAIEAALAQPGVAQAVEREVQAQVRTQVDALGLDSGNIVVRLLIDTAVSEALGSETLQALAADQVQDMQRQLARELSEPQRAPAPLLLTIDVTQAVNERLDLSLGSVQIEVALPPVVIEVVGAETFEQMRERYVDVERASRRGGWVALALWAAALVITPRRPWFVTKAAAAVAACSALVWWWFATRGLEGLDESSAWFVLAQSAVDQVAESGVSTMAWITVSAAAVAVVSAAVTLGLRYALSPRRAS